jgi:hypothetical protein
MKKRPKQTRTTAERERIRMKFVSDNISHTPFPDKSPKKKPSYPCSDLNDVTLGSSAVFSGALEVKWGQQEN